MNIFLSFVLIVGIVCIGGEILKYENDKNDEGYHFKYITSDGQKREETGIYEKKGEDLILRVKGSSSYQGKNGKKFNVTYKADVNGFRRPEESLRIPPNAIASLAGGGLG